MEQTTLYFRQGSSDKVYQATIEEQNGGYVVSYAFGRRGTTLQTGTKTQAPVGYEEAKRIFDRLVDEKTAKGYTPGENGTPYEHSDKKKRVAGIMCQLLNSIDESEATRLIGDPAFCLQEKLDGRRLLLEKRDGEINGINRLGLFVGVPEPIAAAARKLPVDCVLDGEAVGETLHVFDLLKIDGSSVQGQNYQYRYRQLGDLVRKAPGCISLVPTALSKAEKALAFCTFKAMKGEGVVFKRLDAPYTPGRPASGGPQLKFKFCETASFIVSHVNAKRSVSLVLLDGDKTVPVGNVTNGAGSVTIATTGAGSGTVTNTGGNLTSNAVVLGAGTADTKVVSGITTDGTSQLALGVAGTSVGSVLFNNATSGSITLSPPTGALATKTLSFPMLPTRWWVRRPPIHSPIRALMLRRLTQDFWGQHD